MITVAGYTLDEGLHYDRDNNLWVERISADAVRIGFDPLGAETTGDVVAVSFPATGTAIEVGGPLATIEAAKFVGPMPSPVSGVVSAVNDDVALSPGTVNTDPLGTWLVTLDGVPVGDLDRLVSGEDAIREWFSEAVDRFKAQGVIAE